MKKLPQDIIHDSARHFGLEPAALSFLGGGQDWSDGTLYEAPHQDGQRVIKILQLEPGDRDGLRRAEDRVAFVRHFGEHGCPIINPVPGADGRLFRVAERPEGSYLSYAYRKAEGRSISADEPAVRDGSYFRAVGRLMGQLHKTWEGYPEELGADGGSTASPALRGWRDESAFFRGWCREPRVARAWDRLAAELGRLPVDKAGYGFVHNDIHQGNLLLADAAGQPRFTLIDFDVANWHWYMNDCAIALYSFLSQARGGLESGRPLPAGFRERAFGAYWEGYGEFRDPGAAWLDRLELFLHYRRCLLFMPFQEASARQPAWRQRWIEAIEAGDRTLLG
jgi:Ser/Thr protein kinase RdoA (MazF antagonist)